jgi:hypothetical protein
MICINGIKTKIASDHLLPDVLSLVNLDLYLQQTYVKIVVTLQVTHFSFYLLK